MLVDALLKEAKYQSVTCVCLFTRIPDFFARMGFREVEKEALPDGRTQAAPEPVEQRLRRG